jgi:hypothetical protein
MNLKQLINANSQRLGFLIRVFIVLTGFIGYFLKQLDDTLMTDHTPNGILSLHLVRNASDAYDVRNAWQEIEGDDGISAAINSLILDFGFILAYGGLLYVIFAWEWLKRNENKKPDENSSHNYLFLLATSVIVVDIIENILCILFLKEIMTWTIVMRCLSLLKYWLLILNIAFMKNVLHSISDYAKKIFSLILRFRIVVISLLIIYLILWKSDQGQDLVVSLNTSIGGVIVFFLVVSITAFLHWHIPKFLSRNTVLFVNGQWEPKTVRQWMHDLFFKTVSFTDVGQGNVKYVTDSDLARTFGVMTFLIPAFGVLNVIGIFTNRDFYAGVLLLICSCVVLFVLDNNQIDNAFRNPKYRWMFQLYFVITVVALIVFSLRNTPDPSGLWYLFSALLLMAGAFLILVSIRKWVVVALSDKKIGPLVMCSAIGLALFFIYSNIDPVRIAANTNINYATFAIFFSGVIFYCVLFLFFILWGRTTERNGSRINIAGIVIAVSILSALLFDNRFHDVNLVERGPQNSQPLPLREYIRNWLADSTRAKIINTYSEKRRYPIFIVNAYGGGIRAAAWTSLAIANLDLMVLVATEKKENFQDHVFAYSGASGGTIGASVMVALRKKKYRLQSMDKLVELYRKDFLSPVIVGLIGRDFWASTFGANWTDRARFQDRIWEAHIKSCLFDSIYNAPITSIWNNSYDVPLLFANSSHVEKGVKAIVAPVKLDSIYFPKTVDVMEKIYGDETKRRIESKDDKNVGNWRKPKTLKLSTAAFMSARFPFISPAGRIDGNHHFLDGGIVENSGAETASELATFFLDCLDSATKQKVEIIIVSLSNSPPGNPREKEKNLFEISAPLTTLVANVDGNALHADYHNKLVFGKNYFKINPKPIDASDTSNTAILPLGWQLSENALKRLKQNLQLNPARQTMDSIVSRFKK